MHLADYVTLSSSRAAPLHVADSWYVQAGRLCCWDFAGTYTPLHAFREAYAKARAIGVGLSDSSSSDSEIEDLMPSPRTGIYLAACSKCCFCCAPVHLANLVVVQV